MANFTERAIINPELWLARIDLQNSHAVEVPFLEAALESRPFSTSRTRRNTHHLTFKELGIGAAMLAMSFLWQAHLSNNNNIEISLSERALTPCFERKDENSKITMYSRYLGPIDKDGKSQGGYPHSIMILDLAPNLLSEESPEYIVHLNRGDHSCEGLSQIGINLKYIKGTYFPHLEWNLVANEYVSTYHEPGFDPQKPLHLDFTFEGEKDHLSMSSSLNQKETTQPTP